MELNILLNFPTTERNDQNYLKTNETNNTNLSKSIKNSNCSQENLEILFDFTNKLLIIYPWLMGALGIFSNIISLIVLTRPKLKKSSTFFYLACLCIIDLISLLTFCFNFIFLYQFKIDLQLKHVILCKLYSFLIYFMPQLSAWTCAAVSLDRVIGVIFSVRGKYAAAAKRWNTPKKALKIIVCIFFSLLLLNLQFFFYQNEYEIIDDEKDVNVIYCSPEHIPRYQYFYGNYWVYIDLSVNVLIPFAVMIACSFIIVIGVVKSTKNLPNQSTYKKTIHKKEKLNNLDDNAIEIENARKTLKKKRIESQVRFKQNEQEKITSPANEPLINSRKQSFSRKKKLGSGSKAKNVSTMLAANNIVFICLTLPIVVFQSLGFDGSWFRNQNICDSNKTKIRFIKVICIILMNANCSINIFIYSIMSSEFRRTLFILISKFFCRRSNDNPSMIENSTKRQPSRNISGNQNQKIASTSSTI